MILHAMLLAPRSIPASALVKVAQFWPNNTHIALRQAAHTRKTIALLKTFVGLSAAGDAVDSAAIRNFDVRANLFIQGNLRIADNHLILHHVVVSVVGRHFPEMSGFTAYGHGFLSVKSSR